MKDIEYFNMQVNSCHLCCHICTRPRATFMFVVATWELFNLIVSVVNTTALTNWQPDLCFLFDKLPVATVPCLPLPFPLNIPLRTHAKPISRSRSSSHCTSFNYLNVCGTQTHCRMPPVVASWQRRVCIELCIFRILFESVSQLGNLL